MPYLRAMVACAGLLIGLTAVAADPGDATCPGPTPSGNERWSGETQWLSYEHAGMRYGAIHIQIDEVYDLAQPGEDVWYTRLADTLRIPTRQRVIRQLLLIQTDQPVQALQVYEAIRRLRQQLFLRDADIRPDGCAHGVVNVWVDARDAWTLKLDVEFARAGNANQFRFYLQDADFLGSGQLLSIGHEKTLERSENVLEYSSPSLAGSDGSLSANYAVLSDGHSESLDIARPFLLDTTPWAADVSVLDQSLHLNYYNEGAQAWYLPQSQQQLTASWQGLLDISGDTVLRAGLGVNDAKYSYAAPVPVTPVLLPPPGVEPRTLVGIGPIFSLHQDRYATFTNLQYVGRPEDYNLGWDITGRVFYDSKAFGATANGPDVSLTASDGFELAPNWLVLADGSAFARRDDGTWNNVGTTAEATIYGQPWRWQTLVFHADYASLLRPDPENRLYIGGFQALRGYPNFYATGSQRMRVTFEDRVVTPMVLFDTFQVGFVAFSDSARIDRYAGQGWSPWYSSAGVGLRIGNLRGSFDRVLYFTVAEPLRTDPGVRSGVQFVVGDVLTF
ncbi:MAG: hypothetical protein P4L92_20195 [Rudaea sp.]|nr:hypothetical protein [Rudaea sp.]